MNLAVLFGILTVALGWACISFISTSVKLKKRVEILNEEVVYLRETGTMIWSMDKSAFEQIQNSQGCNIKLMKVNE